MSKAEDSAEKAYPQELDGYCENNAAMRVGYKIGYHQAEKDLELSWEDIKLIGEIIDDAIIENLHNDKWFEEELYMEVLKCFKERKDK